MSVLGGGHISALRTITFHLQSQNRLLAQNFPEPEFITYFTIFLAISVVLYMDLTTRRRVPLPLIFADSLE